MPESGTQRRDPWELDEVDESATRVAEIEINYVSLPGWQICSFTSERVISGSCGFPRRP
jgi:hypothetical protein